VESLTVRQVCRDADATSGSLYHHFQSMEGLLEVAIDVSIAEWVEGFLARLHGSESAVDGLARAFKYHGSWVAKQPELAALIFRSARRASEGGSSVTIRHGVASWLIKHRLLDGVPPNVVSSLMFGPLIEATRLQILNGKFPPSAYVALAKGIHASLVEVS